MFTIIFLILGLINTDVFFDSVVGISEAQALGFSQIPPLVLAGLSFGASMMCFYMAYYFY